MSHSVFRKWVASLVCIAFLSTCNAGCLLAAEPSITLPPTFRTAQAVTFSSSQLPISNEEAQALQAVYEQKIQRVEAEIERAKGVRKNLLTVAVASFSAGAAINFAVNIVNNAIDDIPNENPEDQVTNPDDIEGRYDACQSYVCTADEKDDAQDALDGIQGIGGAIFIVGALGMAGYWLYSRQINGKQEQIDDLRAELGRGFVNGGGITPEYLQRNESVAAVLEEIDEVKKEAGRTRTLGEVFSRLAISGILSGLFLVGVANTSQDLIGNITLAAEGAAGNDAEALAAKDDALDKADTVESVGWAVLGVGFASGVTSFAFSRWANRKDRQIDDLENGLLRVADRIRIRPRADGVMVTYTYNF